MTKITIDVELLTEPKFFILMQQLGTATTSDGEELSISTGGMNVMVYISDRQYLVPLQALCEAVVNLDAMLMAVNEVGEIPVGQTAERILDRIGNVQGWDVWFKLGWALEYIENQRSNDAFEDFLAQAAEEENEDDE